MTDFTAYRHPVLAVACPTCRKRAGVMCIRPSGHGASDFHGPRKAEADRQFIEQHGERAAIYRDGEGWRIDPFGIEAAPEPAQLSLAFESAA